MDSLSETAGNNRPIQGLSHELCATALKGRRRKGTIATLAQFCTSLEECCRCVGRIRRRPRLGGLLNHYERAA